MHAFYYTQRDQSYNRGSLGPEGLGRPLGRLKRQRFSGEGDISFQDINWGQVAQCIQEACRQASVPFIHPWASAL